MFLKGGKINEFVLILNKHPKNSTNTSKTEKWLSFWGRGRLLLFLNEFPGNTELDSCFKLKLYYCMKRQCQKVLNKGISNGDRERETTKVGE